MISKESGSQILSVTRFFGLLGKRTVFQKTVVPFLHILVYNETKHAYWDHMGGEQIGSRTDQIPIER